MTSPMKRQARFLDHSIEERAKFPHTIPVTFDRACLPLYSHNTNLLLDFCESERWYDAYRRSHTHPEEAVPQALPRTKRTHECIPASDISTNIITHNDSPLGIACRKFSNQMVEGTWDVGTSMHVRQIDVIKALYHACPDQILFDQKKIGRTPLLDAICNPVATFELVKFMVDAHCSSGVTNIIVIGRCDCNGLAPLNHLIKQVHRNEIIAPESFALESISYMIQKCPFLLEVGTGDKKACDQQNTTSPLIQLLSQKAGYSAYTKRVISRTSHVTECAKILLSANPGLILTKSVMTACTPLHMALRNDYGDDDELLDLIFQHDPNGDQIKTRNNFGDLPIHIAATVGVSVNTLRKLLEHILKTSNSSRVELQQCSELDPIRGPNRYIWAVNDSGYTPIHLMWMRKIDGKNPYPLSYSKSLSRASGNISRKSYYHTHLVKAISDMASIIRGKDSSRKVEVVAHHIMGSFWECLLLYLKATQSYCIREKTQGLEDDFLFLHAACALISPYLPRPIIDLAFVLYSKQVKITDKYGRTPLHYACAAVSSREIQLSLNARSKTKTTLYIGIGWSEIESTKERRFRYSCSNMHHQHELKDSVIHDILSRYPRAAILSDNNLSLPLHFAIESEKQCETMEYNTNEYSNGHCTVKWLAEVKRISEAYPEALDRRNPSFSCYPFMQAAVGAQDSIDNIYLLLRMSPGRIMKH